MVSNNPKINLKTHNQFKIKKILGSDLPYKGSSRGKTPRINSPHQNESIGTKITLFLTRMGINDDFLSLLLTSNHFLFHFLNQ
jgi:hypothetical protein